MCEEESCRLLKGHKGSHKNHPNVWGFFKKVDKNKISKAGFATPRGGKKGGYQNHVNRNNQVVIPYEQLSHESLSLYKDGYVIRLYPEQYFESKHTPKAQFTDPESKVVVGDNAYVLYRTWESFKSFPPLSSWSIRHLEHDGSKVQKRGKHVQDVGHYLLRLSTSGSDKKKDEGPPQGIFAAEYADKETNYLCKCLLAYFIINTYNSPYTTSQAEHLIAILSDENLIDTSIFEKNGTMRRGLTCCPLCQKILRYSELHDTISFEEADALSNASMQLIDSTRSTVVNLFHLKPLLHHSLTHIPVNVGWGHAVCNTYLGQRECLSLYELQEMEMKVAILLEDRYETFGWISTDKKFIRSPNGAVWIRISDDMSDYELNFPDG
ncbi:restriction endonuclease [Salibacter halophilus]|uniref:Restriction endonuclease n=1 Tax=Salibacter halophilus TaxID=1803916 RepID=A0A6N6MAK7_9FLAO|nr:restriction endonuclease [Salibacter halophilus]